MDEIKTFEVERDLRVRALQRDTDFQALSRIWIREGVRHKYVYNFSWMGRPIIQLPTDMAALQEIIWNIKPEVIIETGVAHGGSVLYYASLLELFKTGGFVVGVDIEIREHNRREIEKNPLSSKIRLIEGSSIDGAVFKEVRKLCSGKKKVLVCLDSNHSADHVLKELQLYSQLVSAGSYIVVFDTIVADLPGDLIVDRPWNSSNNPKMAVHQFLSENSRFEIDREMEAKIGITVCNDGFLRCLKD
jgi:cephalosporin hydroxylase